MNREMLQKSVPVAVLLLVLILLVIFRSLRVKSTGALPLRLCVRR